MGDRYPGGNHPFPSRNGSFPGGNGLFPSDTGSFFGADIPVHNLYGAPASALQSASPFGDKHCKFQNAKLKIEN
jgi:hypothetical protein